MNKRYLGKNKLEVSTIGLGCLGMSEAYGEPNDTESIATVHMALDLGINLFDTADVYGMGGNEELLGKALRNKRDKAIISTKFGCLLDRNGKIVGVNGKPQYVKQACDASLKRLGVEYIDLYFLHRVDRDTPIEETVGGMVKLIKDGKIRHIGLSEVSAQTLQRANAIYPITALQNEYSLWTRDAEGEILSTCCSFEIGFIAYSPLGRGFLTGKIRNLEELVPHDSRRFRYPRFQTNNLQQNLTVLKVVEEISQEKGCKASQIALAWVLAQGGNVVPIPGTKRRKYLQENIEALNIVLTTQDINRMNEIAQTIVGERYTEEIMSRMNQ